MNQDKWWDGGTIYQIYPKSFCDSSGNGVGDLKGITSKLPYISSIGVDAIWISPFFESPMQDGGYDVSNYTAVDPLFGTIGDFQELVDSAHKLNLRIIIDQVYSHTSNLHPWFLESQSSRENDRSEWYVWADPKPDGSVPNNWQAFFGGPAWTWCSARRQYYLNHFSYHQPDLNFYNPQVQSAILEVAKFWLELGVDGFRLDVCNYYYHSECLSDNPPRQFDEPPVKPYHWQKHVFDKSRPETKFFLTSLRKLCKDYGDRFLVGEIDCDDQITRAAEYTTGDDLLHTAYSFSFLGAKSIDRKTVEAFIGEFYQKNPDGCPAWSFSNHDCTRVLSRWYSENPNPSSAVFLLKLLLSLPGTRFVYQGEELGLPQAFVPREKLQDLDGIKFWPAYQGRDGCRTPIPWTSELPHCGFSTGTQDTWLPIVHEHKEVNVSNQEADQESVLNRYRKFVGLLEMHPILKKGKHTLLSCENPNILMIKKQLGDSTTLSIFNFSDSPETFELDSAATFKDLEADSDILSKDRAVELEGKGSLFLMVKPN